MYDLVAIANQYSVPAELMETLKGNFSDSFGESFSRLSLKGFQFTLKSGGTSDVINTQALNCVILGEGVDDFCTYYSGPYTPDAEDVKPDAVWYKSQPAPVVVPQVALEKDQSGRFGYSIKRRIVLAIFDEKGNLSFTPVVFDVGAMSLYDKDYANAGMLSYASYRRWCAKRNLLPCMIVTQIVFDRSVSVPSVRFKPVCDQDGTPRILPQNGLLQEVFKVAGSDDVKSLLKVNLIDGSESSDAEGVAQPQVQPQPQPQPQVQPQPQSQPQVQPQVQSQPQAPVVTVDDNVRTALADADDLLEDPVPGRVNEPAETSGMSNELMDLLNKAKSK